MNERTYLNGLYDNLINNIYIAFSDDSRKILKNELESYNTEIRNYFFHLVRFSQDKWIEEGMQISNWSYIP